MGQTGHTPTLAVADGMSASGYYEVVPGTDWVACQVYRLWEGDEPTYFDIIHVGDDPLFDLRTAGNSPWLTAADRAAINAPHKADARRYRATMRSFELSYWGPLRDREARALWTEPVKRRAHEAPETAFQIMQGGWLPSGVTADHLGLFARDVGEMQAARDRGDYDLADLIRRVITGGTVEVQIKPTGTLWFFDEDGVLECERRKIIRAHG